MARSKKARTKNNVKDINEQDAAKYLSRRLKKNDGITKSFKKLIDLILGEDTDEEGKN